MQHWATDWNSLGGGETLDINICQRAAELVKDYLCRLSYSQTGNLLFNLRGTVHKVVAPELEGRILDQLDEGDEETPRVRPVHYQPLQQNPGRGGQHCD